MMRTWRTIALPAFLTVALGVAPAAAEGQTGSDGPSKPGQKTLKEQFEELDKNLAKSFNKVGADIAALQKDLKDLRDERADAEVKLKLTLAAVGTLEKTIADLKGDIEAMRKRMPADVAFYPPPADKAALDEIRTRLANIEQTLKAMQQERTRVALSPPATTLMLLVLFW
jgi:hypothetical protein